MKEINLKRIVEIANEQENSEREISEINNQVFAIHDKMREKVKELKAICELINHNPPFHVIENEKIYRVHPNYQIEIIEADYIITTKIKNQ